LIYCYDCQSCKPLLLSDCLHCLKTSTNFSNNITLSNIFARSTSVTHLRILVSCLRSQFFIIFIKRKSSIVLIKLVIKLVVKVDVDIKIKVLKNAYFLALNILLLLCKLLLRSIISHRRLTNLEKLIRIYQLIVCFLI